MKWVLLIESIALIICVTKCIGYKIAAKSLAYYMQAKGCTLPTGQELRTCINYATKQMFHLSPK